MGGVSKPKLLKFLLATFVSLSLSLDAIGGILIGQNLVWPIVYNDDTYYEGSWEISFSFSLCIIQFAYKHTNREGSLKYFFPGQPTCEGSKGIELAI